MPLVGAATLEVVGALAVTTGMGPPDTENSSESNCTAPGGIAAVAETARILPVAAKVDAPGPQFANGAPKADAAAAATALGGWAIITPEEKVGSGGFEYSAHALEVSWVIRWSAAASTSGMGLTETETSSTSGCVAHGTIGFENKSRIIIKKKNQIKSKQNKTKKQQQKTIISSKN